MRLAIVIPVYNEQATLPALVARIDATPPPRAADGPVKRRIVLVDDGSNDETGAIVKGLSSRADVMLVQHKQNMGKGAAVRSGLAAALQDGADVILIQDGDLEYDPADHAPVLAPILDGRADAVIGSRFLGQTHRVLYYWHWVGNQRLTRLSNMLTNLNLSDIECCLKAFRRQVAEELRLRENRFGIEPEIIARLARMRLPEASEEPGPDAAGGVVRRPLRVYEVPVSYAGRTYAEGKKITWRDGFAAIWCIIKYNIFG